MESITTVIIGFLVGVIISAISDLSMIILSAFINWIWAISSTLSAIVAPTANAKTVVLSYQSSWQMDAYYSDYDINYAG